MKFKTTIFFILFVTTICSCKKPNIIVIMADDSGWNDFSFHGQNQIPTPNIDALAYNGVVLNKFYTQQTCTPSRAAMLTGNYPFRSGMQSIPIDAGEDRSIPANMPLMSERLKELGYKTHLVGKWHLGGAKKDQTPTGRGFDTFFGYWYGWIGYYDYSLLTPLSKCNITGIPPSVSNTQNITCLKGLDLHDGDRAAWEYQGQYATTVFTNKAVDIIEKHNREEPLFLFLSHLAGHSGKDSYELEVPDIEENDREFFYIKDVGRRRYAGIMKEFDNSVGKVMLALERKKLLSNSIVLVLSDNGPQTIGVYANKGSAWPLRGLKFTPYEGGVRGTAVLYSPSLRYKGKISNNLMHIADLLPTFYSAAGGNVSKLGPIDGIDQWKAIRDDYGPTRKDLIININDGDKWSAIVSENGRYKLINGSFDGGVYDAFYGDCGRSDINPTYNYNNILFSDASIAIARTDSSNPFRVLETGPGMRKRLDYGKVCSEYKRRQSSKFVCKGFCLFDLQKDPCETEDISIKYPYLVETMKQKMSPYWNEIVLQPKKFIDPAADPKYCNGTWFLWKENPAFIQQQCKIM